MANWSFTRLNDSSASARSVIARVTTTPEWMLGPTPNQGRQSDRAPPVAPDGRPSLAWERGRMLETEQICSVLVSGFQKPTATPQGGSDGVVCRDAPEPFEALREHLGRLGAELMIERRPGPLSALLGRPAVVVADRYLDVVASDPDPSPEAVREAIEWAGRRCEECPQAADESPDLAAAWRAG